MFLHYSDVNQSK